METDQLRRPCLPKWSGRSRYESLLYLFTSLSQNIRVVAFLLVLFLCSTNATLGLEGDKNIDQYGHDSWTFQNGLPGEAVYQILQTPDGYLWLRTSAGLVRFDGVRFVVVEPVIDNKPVGEPLRAICKNPDGNLLIRTTSRTILYKDGVWNNAGASVGIYLKPRIYQTTWFYGFCVLAIILCIVAGQRIHTHRLRLRAEELTRVVNERTKDLKDQRAFLRQVIDI